jgi:uncharacterized protein involved in exopolysaccharide biosynthesis
VDQGPDKSKPPSTSYRETFRRHRRLFCTPPILGALAAAVFLFGMGKTYKSTASLWIDTAPSVPSSVGENNTALAQPPASAEQAILSELLTTRRFAASVAEAVGKSLGSPAAIEANAAKLLSNGQLVQSVQGNQLLQISYSASSPAMAESVLRAVIAQLSNYADRLTAQHDQAAAAYDREQVKVAETALTTARSNVTAYQAQHPGSTHTDDPNYVSLVAAENNAATQLAQANAALSQVTGTGKGNDWSIQVLDAPTQASTTPLGKKKMAEVIVGGVLGGLLVSFLAVAAMTPAKKEVWEDELPVGAPFASDVPPPESFRAWSPGVPTAAARSTPAAAVGQHRLSLGDRRFHFGTRSAPTEEQ